MSDAPLGFGRILVTGGSGFVGRHLVPALSARLAADGRMILAVPEPAGDGPFEQVRFDLGDGEAIDRAIASVRPDLVVHLAAQSSVGTSLGKAAGDTWAANVCGSVALARAMARHVPDATMLFVSSAEVYGLSFNDEPVNEDSVRRPLNPYARSKAAAEDMFADVLPASARLIVVRPSNHSGPGQDTRFVVPAFASQIAAIEAGSSPGRLFVGNLDARRDFLDVRDIVAAYLGLLANAASFPARSIFNVASGQPMAVSDLLARLVALCARPVEIVQDPARMRQAEVPLVAIDASRIRRATGWSPRHSLSEMLGSVLDAEREKIHR